MSNYIWNGGCVFWNGEKVNIPKGAELSQDHLDMFDSKNLAGLIRDGVIIDNTKLIKAKEKQKIDLLKKIKKVKAKAKK